MEHHPFNIRTAIAHQHGMIYRSSDATTRRRLVLLHGAGIAGEMTWTYVVNYLKSWEEVLVVDFAGMGKSAFHDCEAPTLNEYVVQISELLSALDWQTFDLAGYSFGGMITSRLVYEHPGVGLCFLLEPALLSGTTPESLLDKAQRYRTMADWLDQHPNDQAIYRQFLDIVSPKRRANAASDRIAISRLKPNQVGFCQALRAVSETIESSPDALLNWQSPKPGMSFVGALSSDEMRLRQQQLEASNPDWFGQVINGADHSLVFTHPKPVARLMDERLTLLLEAL
ncbi:MAG: alpha/beta hydrolase [Oceanobacter sp.]